jgi:hypothetical protein
MTAISGTGITSRAVKQSCAADLGINETILTVSVPHDLDRSGPLVVAQHGDEDQTA